MRNVAKKHGIIFCIFQHHHKNGAHLILDYFIALVVYIFPVKGEIWWLD